MGRTVAVIWHVSFSIVAAGLYFFFVLPRWNELVGDTSPTLGLILRIVTGALIGLAALPVVFTLQRTKRAELATPELALRLRTASISLHVLAAVLIIGTAVSEIWLSLDSFGPWLFGIYGAAAAIALLGIFAFYLAFVAELPPPPPKPRPTLKRPRSRRPKSRRPKKTRLPKSPKTPPRTRRRVRRCVTGDRPARVAPSAGAGARAAKSPPKTDATPVASTSGSCPAKMGT